MLVRSLLSAVVFLCIVFPLMVLASGESSDYNPQRNAYFGDLHVHTGFSWDASLFGTDTLPDDAYRYAKGEAINFAGGGKIQMKHSPLDFYAVTDHAECLGVFYWNRNKHPIATRDDCDKANIYHQIVSHIKKEASGQIDAELCNPTFEHSAWKETIAAAERHYVPGKFTTFIGYEWTSNEDGLTLHRNVLFRGNWVADRPFSALDSKHPEDLWNWLDRLRSQGVEALAIPHNPNMSGGLAFTKYKSDGADADARYAAQRKRNEPIVEITQVKGTSETHPVVSPSDEWADFEILGKIVLTESSDENMPKTNPSTPLKYKGNYVRQAYKSGLELYEKKGVNPYKFGVIGSTDTHNSGSCQEEDNYFGKAGCLTAYPADRLAPPKKIDSRKYSAAALAGVWAEENTRDPRSAPLQRIQIVKGWMQTDIAMEKVFDVAGSDGLIPDPATHRIPNNGAKVDLKTGKWEEDKGASKLSTVWKDPEFNPKQQAFYYVRVLENPTLRWSTYDANRLGIAVPKDLPKTIQERAFTSPIWYCPTVKPER